MAKIPLRDYLNGVEELIDNGQTEEALAHCRHILETYSKHIDTYRMMGKAYLEAHRHSEASDIFQRVLSSVPDDFVSHIGMSIVREEGGDQDAAIWHMERAFEAQPSNRPVQDELRRLYGKREGYAPPKVRLTRGALARMYAHGDLYNQAIAELRSALSEDADRPDLQILLAEMYFKTNRQADAIDVCSKLIEKLPYCLVANSIMASILTASNRDVEARPYLERVEELDPYLVQADSLRTADQVPADRVMIEQLELDTPVAQDKPLPKAWTGMLQMPEGSGQKEDLPDWLSEENFQEPATETEEQPTDTEPSVLDSLESLDPATGSLAPKMEDTEPTPAFVSKSPSTALVDDQIPEWLRELRPATSTLTMPEEKSPHETQPIAPAPSSPRWTDEFKTAGLNPTMLPADEREAEAEISAFEEYKMEEPAPASAADDDSLGWLEDLAAKQGAAEEELITTPEQRQKATQEWEAEAPAEGKRDVLSWLDEMATDAPPPESKADLPKSTTDWLAELKTGAQPNQEEEPARQPAAWKAEEPAQPAPQSSAWMSEEPAPPARKADEPEALTASAWLKELSPEQNEPAKTESASLASDWGIELPASEETQEQDPLESTVPSWLQDLSAEVEERSKEEIAPRAMEERPDWLDELRMDTAPIPAEKATEREPEIEPVEDWKPANLDEINKLDWLEELAPMPTDQAAQPEPEAWVPEPELSPSMSAEPGAEAVAQSPRRSASLKAAEEAPQRLEQARQALNYNKHEDAADHYGFLLRRRVMLDEVIADLSAAVRRNPSNATLWQTLGDAYMRNNQLREALDSYTKAEDLL